jgi:hypothetical protein
MKLEDQVCSFRQSKILAKHLPVFQTEPYFWYTKSGGIISVDNFHWQAESWIPTYTVAELGVLLHGYIIFVNNVGFWQLSKATPLNALTSLSLYKDIPEAHARADALIWLIEEDFEKPEDLKL